MRTDEEATQRMTTATDVQEQAREVYRQSVAAEMPLTGRQLGEMFDRSERWGRDRIAEVKRETAERLPLELPFSGSAAGESAAEPVSAVTAAGRQNGSGDGSRAAVERQPERQAAGDAAETAVIAAVPVASRQEPASAVESTRQAADGAASGRQGSGKTAESAASERQAEEVPQEIERQDGRVSGKDAAAGQVPRGVTVTAWLAVGVVAAVAATVSFEHMRELAERSGEGWRSWLLPLSADGLILAGSLVMYVHSLRGQSGPWLAKLALFGGLLVSVAANVGTALLPDAPEVAVAAARQAAAAAEVSGAAAVEALAAIETAARQAAEVPESVQMAVAGFPPLALIVAAELLMQLIRLRQGTGTEAARTRQEGGRARRK